MHAPSALHVFCLAGWLATAGLLTSTDVVAARQTGHPSRKPPEPVVTPVEGPSWLNHLQLGSGSSSLGRGANRYGPAPDAHAVPHTPESFVAGQAVELSGADIYRLNCQACHREEGTGAPPEIKSVLDLVRGSSLELVRKQLSAEGKDASLPAARAMAAETKQALYLRIRHGGQRMPALGHLDSADVDVLYAYLTKLAQVPDAPPQTSRPFSWARLGEHVIKGTCHICHDAVGPRPDWQAVLQGAIPPLSVLMAENSQASFIAKARDGAPVTTGYATFHYRGRMPVFYYLQDQELAAAYDFLSVYPPQAGPARRP